MSTNYNDSDQTYRIETRISSGSIEDPVTGEQHAVESNESGRGGTIEVARPDSAKYIVDRRDRRRFVNTVPSEQEVTDARKERFEFAESDVCLSFTDSHFGAFEDVELDPAEGFDPVEDTARNDTKMWAAKAYSQLQEAGHEAEAAYLRALPNVDKQKAFAKFAREQGLIDYE